MRNRNDEGELIASARVVDADIPPLRRVKHNMTSSKTPTALFSSWERYRLAWLRRNEANFCIFAKRCRSITLTTSVPFIGRFGEQSLVCAPNRERLPHDSRSGATKGS